MKKVALIIVGGTVLFGASLELVGCDDSSSSPPPTASSSGTTTSSGGSSSGASSSGGSSGGSSGTSSSGGTSGGPALTAADKPDIAPCGTQDALTSAADFGTLKTAMSTGTITYLDIPFDGSDPDIYKKKCGIEGSWDPTKNTDSIPVPGGSIPTILNVVQQGNAGICAANYTTFGADDGFPAAGVYRKEFKAASGGSTYHVRARITTSGTAAGKKWGDIPITVAELKSKLTYKVNGTDAAHDDVWTAMINAMAAPAPTATLDAQNAGTTIFTSKVELICVTKQ